jgi:hypothetical protein
MIFKQFYEIATDQKTQTRRIVKPNEVLIKDANGRCYVWNSTSRRVKWEVGKTYPVTPKMYQPTVWVEPNGTLRTDAIYRKQSSINSDTSEWETYRVDQRDTFRERGFHELRIQITAIRKEYLQSLTEADAIAEGLWKEGGRECYQTSVLPGDCYSMAKTGYKNLWHSINTKKGTRWIDDPVVWVIDFTRVK